VTKSALRPEVVKCRFELKSPAEGVGEMKILKWDKKNMESIPYASASRILRRFSSVAYGPDGIEGSGPYRI
jgi:hypothetical protein